MGIYQMRAIFNQIGSCARLLTSHGTVMFVDANSGELRHGQVEGSPSNVILVREGEQARLKYINANGQKDIACFSEYSTTVGWKNMMGNGPEIANGNVFKYVSAGQDQRFGLTDRGCFLSAEADGRVTLSRTVCDAWERFRVSITEVSASLLEQIKWLPVHGAALRIDDDGVLIFGDGATLDWHLLRWTNPRLNGTRVRLAVVAKPAKTCDTNLYVHHWGGKDVCSIDKSGTVVLDEGAEKIHVEHRSDGYLATTIVFENRHPTLSLGTGKPRGHYRGTGVDQYYFKSIEVELLPINSVRKVVFDRLWKGYDPFRALRGRLLAYDLQGWNSQHSYLSDTIAAIHPTSIVEIGVWKGGSTVFMASELKKLALSSVIIAVDTWLGSSEHWLRQSNAELEFLDGRPDLYHKFLSNVVHAGVTDYVVPLPVDSLNAAQIVNSLPLRPQMIHLDGGHDYDSVIADLRAWWPILAQGGVIVGDDYYTNGTWPEVRKAFDEFFGALSLTPIENVAGKCRVRKG
jgi:predicted O-methyltransferase YrrM